MVQDTKIIKTYSIYLFIKIPNKKGGGSPPKLNVNFLIWFYLKSKVFLANLSKSIF